MPDPFLLPAVGLAEYGDSVPIDPKHHLTLKIGGGS